MRTCHERFVDVVVDGRVLRFVVYQPTEGPAPGNWQSAPLSRWRHNGTWYIPENRDFVVELLNALGFETHVAENGRAGVEAALAMQPDLVLMDNVMPVMSGAEATHRLRQVPGFADVPIIAMSASVTLADQHSSLLTGANAFVAKPVNINLLLHHIGELLKLAWIRQPAK